MTTSEMDFFSKTSNPLYSSFIHKSRYARWLDDKGRRETWEETVDRYIQFFCDRFPNQAAEITNLRSSILNLDVMPSMRCLMTAGKALDRDNAAGFNCCFLAIDHVRCFDETLYLLMCGCGVGFSVENQFVSKLPEIAEELYDSDTVINVADSKIGWASAFRELLSLLWSGKIPKWDLSKLRPHGARLKTFGGRSSGPKPLDALFRFAVDTFKKAKGRRLTSLECHDLICKVADVVVSGGTRRSALISLSDLDDSAMRNAKQGQWYIENPQRQLANNSAVYEGHVDFDVFLSEWKSLYDSKAGERGIFSRDAALSQVKKSGRRNVDYAFGCNPCSEIILRPNQMCNLSEVVIRSTDTLDSLKKKVEVATILGTLQSSLTNFRYLRKIWEKNTKEEALLGVSFTGIMDHAILGDHENPELPAMLEELREHANKVNTTWAVKLGVNRSASITCTKPSGTVSQLVDSASGIHPRFSEYYIRRVRADIKDPLAQFMHLQGFPCEPEETNANRLVFSFPVACPASSTVVKDVTPIDQLKLWMIYQDHWCEHKPSMTVYYTDKTFFSVGDFVWNNLSKISGISFCPTVDHIYKQAPYEEITQDEYHLLMEQMPKTVDWLIAAEFEKEDNTVSSQNLACSSGSCEIVDL